MNDRDIENVCTEIRRQVDEFVDEWKKNPTQWLQEIDVQCDLAQRISSILKEQKKDVIRARHSHYHSEQDFSRLTCEPYVSLGGAGTSYAHPDIVVWDDPDGSANELNSGKWPIIWACEIKYTTGEPDATDLDRLRRMLGDKTLRVGCWIKLIIDSDASMSDHDKTDDANLWIVEARVTIK